MSEAGEATWRLMLDGKSELRNSEDEQVAAPTRLAFLVLAMLVMEGDRGWRRDVLAGAVWPESNPVSARASLRTALSGLRKILPPGAIETPGSRIRVRPGLITTDLDSGREGGDAIDFMPGFETEWTNETRLRLSARDSGDIENIELDRGFSGSRNGLGPDLPGQDDPRIAGAGVSDCHPLVLAAMWLLDSKPEDALNMVASTRTAWLATPVAQAIEVHRRVLASASEPSAERSVVEANYLFLRALAEPSLDVAVRAKDAFQGARSEEDLAIAYRLTVTLGFAHLAAGHFDLALRYGSRHAQLGSQSSSPALQMGAVYNSSSLELHAGQNLQAVHDRFLRNVEWAFSSGDVTGAAMSSINAAWIELASGKAEKARRTAAPALDGPWRYENDRMRPYVDLLDAEFEACLGDRDRAIATLLRLRAAGPAICGYSAVAVAEDLLMRVHAQVGAFDEAANAWANARVIRALHNCVPTLFERSYCRTERRLLRERLGDDQLRAVLSSVASARST